jgi:hypothetical protein
MTVEGMMDQHLPAGLLLFYGQQDINSGVKAAI